MISVGCPYIPLLFWVFLLSTNNWFCSLLDLYTSKAMNKTNLQKIGKPNTIELITKVP